MIIKENIKLSKYNTFRTGGNARFFCIVKNTKELIEALSFAKEKKVKFFVIGNGSNLLFSDKGFSGLVIKIVSKKITIKRKNIHYAIVRALAGVVFDDLIDFSFKNKFFGLENLWNIPGTVGGAIVQNISAYGAEVGNFVKEVKVMDSRTRKIFCLNKAECGFGYRDSIFKKNKKLIIISVVFKLNRTFIPNIDYSSVKEHFLNNKNILPIEIINFIEKIRKEKLPDWKKVGTAGSFFKNPIIFEKKYKELIEKNPELPKFIQKEGFVKIPLGYVIDKICGLKGQRKGNVGLYEKQALVVVNLGKATTKEIVLFAKNVEKKVFKKIGVKIEREVELIK